MLAFAIAFESFQPVGRWRPEIGKSGSGVEISQLPPRYPDQVGREAFPDLTVRQGFGQSVLEALDHDKLCIIK
jgi:hypothetical protein